MTDIQLAHIGVLLADGDPYAAWYIEALEHAGLIFERLDSIPESRMAQFDMLLLCGEGRLIDPELVELWLNQTAESGHRRALVASGSTWGQDRLFGVATDPKQPRAVQGRLKPNRHAVFPTLGGPARFFGGPRVRIGLGEAHVGTSENTVAVAQMGQAWLVTPHVGKTMAFLQLGTSVETDGTGPEDGTAHWDRGPLRAEYGSRLPFDDREDGVFAIPHADVVRELWLRTVLEAVRTTGKRSAILWHLPRNADHVGVLTLDCDTANPTDLFNLNATLLMTNTRASVLSRPTGYGPDVFGWLRRVGHEVGITFDPNVPGGWHPDRFRMDLSSLMRLASVGPIATGRAAKGTWRGLLQPYEIFAHGGAKSVVSKGGLEAGSAGFLFGTCHPFQPVKPDGRPITILEFPFTIFNAGVVTPNEPIESLIEQVAARHGIFHAVTNLSMVHNEAGFSGLKRWISLLKQSRAEFITIEKLTLFERARRQLKLSVDHGQTIQLISEEPLDGLTVMISGNDVLGTGLSGRTAPQTVHRYGQNFVAFTLDLGDRRMNSLRLDLDEAA